MIKSHTEILNQLLEYLNERKRKLVYGKKILIRHGLSEDDRLVADKNNELVKVEALINEIKTCTE